MPSIIKLGWGRERNYLTWNFLRMCCYTYTKAVLFIEDKWGRSRIEAKWWFIMHAKRKYIFPFFTHILYQAILYIQKHLNYDEAVCQNWLLDCGVQIKISLCHFLHFAWTHYCGICTVLLKLCTTSFLSSISHWDVRQFLSFVDKSYIEKRTECVGKGT